MNDQPNPGQSLNQRAAEWAQKYEKLAIRNYDVQESEQRHSYYDDPPRPLRRWWQFWRRRRNRS